MCGDYKESKKSDSNKVNSQNLTTLKKLPEYSWLNEVDSQVLQQSLIYKRLLTLNSTYGMIIR